MKLQCPQCSHSFGRFSSELVGKRAQCENCAHVFYVRDEGEEQTASLPENMFENKKVHPLGYLSIVGINLTIIVIAIMFIIRLLEGRSIHLSVSPMIPILLIIASSVLILFLINFKRVRDSGRNIFSTISRGFLSATIIVFVLGFVALHQIASAPGGAESAMNLTMFFLTICGVCFVISVLSAIGSLIYNLNH